MCQQVMERIIVTIFFIEKFNSQTSFNNNFLIIHNIVIVEGVSGKMGLGELPDKLIHTLKED